ncbi:U7 snRNA-associated Sm-like protein LSm11 [Sphaeramia orbicularis]|uniref:Sm domain-containing protein n=1 Tax=Sphaeramia orbicularis TaxID=375764 RepID=A0A673BPT6_9TELE|nr:U7 snRNA-associated Sm-like protein LSm11 [Sphaeramia orbicularis]
MEESERKAADSDSKDSASAGGSSAPSEPAHGLTTDSPDDEAAKINVCSDKFDPLVALYSPSVQLPFPNIKCFNNVAEYESFMKGGRGRAKPENVEKRRQKAMKGVADPERIERLKKLMVNNPVPESEEGESSGPPRRRKQRTVKNVLTRMPLCKGSPLGELYRCVEERIRVKVHIRTFKGLRGVCSGFVVAFDKFWNMAMVDVDETYREPLLGEALYHQKALTISRLFEKLKLQESQGGDEAAKREDAQGKTSGDQPKDPQKTQRSQSSHTTSKGDGSGTDSKESCQIKDPQMYGKVHTRHINQIFIRGENVILVCPQPL